MDPMTETSQARQLSRSEAHALLLGAIENRLYHGRFRGDCLETVKLKRNTRWPNIFCVNWKKSKR